MNKTLKFLNNLLKSVGKILYKIWKISALFLGSLSMLGIVGIIVIVIVFVNRGQEISEIEKSPGKIISKGNEDEIVYIMNLNGEIVSKPETTNFFLGPSLGIYPAKIDSLLDSVRNNSNVKGVILKINSPGGSVVASDRIYQSISEISKHATVAVVCNEVSASGGYYIATAADQIFANPATITGSIGVISVVPNLNELYEKIGVEMTVIKSGQYKDMGNPARGLSDSEKEIFQSVINDSYQLFVNRIVEGRNMEKSKVLQLADGRIYSGRQALENGLIDHLGETEEALSYVKNEEKLKNPTLIQYHEKSTFEELFNISAGYLSANNDSLKALNDLLEKPNQKIGVYYLLDSSL